MKIRVRHLLLSLLLTLILAAPALAETRYVIDQLVVNLRDSKGSQYTTIKNLKTGTPMEILEEDGSYVKVRIETGEEGYILKQYVTSNPPGPLVIARLEKELARLKADTEQVKQAKNSAAELKNSAESELSELDAALAKSQQELAVLTKKYDDLRFKSEHIVQLAEERDALDAEHNALVEEVELLRKENEGFQRSSTIRWFLAGGGVFLIGWIVGKVSRKGRRDGFYR